MCLFLISALTHLDMSDWIAPARITNKSALNCNIGIGKLYNRYNKKNHIGKMEDFIIIFNQQCNVHTKSADNFI